MTGLRTAGIDLASQDKNTGCCVIEWSTNPRVVTFLESGCDDRTLIEQTRGATVIGIDAPLGWPKPFVAALRELTEQGTWPKDYLHQRDLKNYRYRTTDLWLSDPKGLDLRLPLSVSTDLIAVPAMRAASLRSQLAPDPLGERTRSIIEIYPAAALAQWGLTSSKYKGREHRENRAHLVENFLSGTEAFLRLSQSQVAQCLENDNSFDALVGAVVARMALIDELIEPIPLQHRDIALYEGWITVPVENSLSKLAQRL